MVTPGASSSCIQVHMCCYIVFPVMKVIKGSTLMRTIGKTLKKCGSLGLLLAFFFYIYAVLCLELFGALECVAENLLVLFKISTGDNWSGILKDTMRPCRPQERHCFDYFIWAAPLVFVTFVVLVQFILFNLIVAAVMQALEESRSQAPDPPIQVGPLNQNELDPPAPPGQQDRPGPDPPAAPDQGNRPQPEPPADLVEPFKPEPQDLVEPFKPEPQDLVEPFKPEPQDLVEPFKPEPQDLVEPFKPEPQDLVEPFKPEPQDLVEPFKPEPQDLVEPFKPEPQGLVEPFKPEPQDLVEPFKPEPQDLVEPFKPEPQDLVEPFKPEPQDLVETDSEDEEES
ncbi:unnamed protein product [Knipowitschia caucasica]